MPDEVEKEPELSGEVGTEKPDQESVEIASLGRTGELFSPAGVIMLPVAAILDLIGIVLICFGLDDFGITDIIGTVLIGGWMYFRSGTIIVSESAKKRAQGWLRNLFRGKGGSKGRMGKFLTPFVFEIIPYVGALPCWTLAVYFELTSQ